MSQFQRKTHRARRLLESAGSVYPGAWQQIDQFRQGRGRDLPDWPDWCYMPIAAGYAIVSGGGNNRVQLDRAHHPAILTALATWRMTQGIFRFDETLRAALLDTPLTGDLPVQHLYRLPHWCVYIETPGLTWLGQPLHGYFAHCEHDIARNGTPELRLLLDVGADPRQPYADATLIPVPVILSAPDLETACAMLVRSARDQAAALGVRLQDGAGQIHQMSTSIAPLVSLLLYLCADPEASRRGAPAELRNPEPVRTRRDGWRLFAADGPAEYDLGVRLGSALRRAYELRDQQRETGAGSSPAPHVRRQHWHSYWSGPKIDAGGAAIPQPQRKLDIRWMPPIAVNVEDYDAMPATVRPVR